MRLKTDITALVILISLLIGIAVYEKVNAQATTISINIVVDGVTTSINFNARQVQLLNSRLPIVNADRVSQGLSQWTLSQYLRQIVISGFRAEEMVAEQREVDAACTAYNALNTTQQNSIKTSLGGNSPCR